MMSGIIFRSVFLLVIGLLANNAYAANPILNFSDLISGPANGLGDGKGSGIIVTVWGNNLGSTQGDSKIEYCDSKSVCRAGHIYYWKNADGNLPGGPANLYESHHMQEVAFSIPDSATGAGMIKVTVNNQESTLPFSVRSGNIYHVMSGGDDSSGDGSFSKPLKTVAQAIINVKAPGSTIYVHNVDSGCKTCAKGIYWKSPTASSSLSAQFAFVAYPNTRPTSTGSRAFTNYQVDGQVISKFDIYASNYLTVDANGQPSNKTHDQTKCFETDRFGRGVGNRCTDIPGGCASGQQGAINGNALSGDEVSSYKIFGNEVYEYGCPGSAKYHHTTYLSIRSGDANVQVEPWQFGWNYFHDNHAKNGIHMFDEKKGTETNCGSPTDTVIINDNVIVNQAGAGISIAANCPWSNDFEVYNNILFNVGLAADWDGVDPATSNGPNTAGISISDNGLMGKVNIYNNTIHTWNDDDQARDSQSCLGMKGKGNNVSVSWSNNVCHTDKDKPFVAAGVGAEGQLDNVSGSNNVWHYSGGASKSAIKPTWDTAAIVNDPLIIIKGPKMIVGTGSPIIGKSNNSLLTYDIYGSARLPGSEIGAIEHNVGPKSPSGITVK